MTLPPPKSVVPPKSVLPQKIRRDQLGAGEVLCDHCSAKCCRYFALPMDEPTEQRDFDFMRWFLMHERAAVFTEDDNWYLVVHTSCKHLQPDHRCGIYTTRPEICREYSTKDCEYEEDWVYDRYFETSEQVTEFMEVVLPRKKGQSIRSPQPELLPVL